ncbi:S8 family peptidase [Deinococcus depolymerans]|uniref:S8 family serine peptidase n=1 Tax=Deinococcus depolymerans TaxID=392408 RepID=A0ABP3LF71_9DEIO
MKTAPTLLSRLALLAAALSLASCGRLPQPAATLPAPAALRSGGQLVTVRVPPEMTAETLLGALPGAQLVTFHPERGSAVLSVPATLRTASLDTQSLRALGVTLGSVEPDAELDVLQVSQAEGLASGLSNVNWASGGTNWAGGATNWAGGESFLGSRDWGNVQTYWNALNLPAAQQLIPELGSGVKVAVLDTGLDSTHPLIRDHVDSVNAWDYVDRDAAPHEMLPLQGLGRYGHGTAVGGIVLQIAPNAQLLPLRVLNPQGRGMTSRIIQAIDRAVAAGAQVINLSLGSDTDSEALNVAVAAATARGVVVVNSSGNAGKEGMVYPAQTLTTGRFTASSGLVAVGSATLAGKKSSFSNYATGMTLVAPGEGVITSYPDSRLAYASGTSFSAPAVSGAVALALSTRAATLNPSSLALNLRSSAAPVPDPLFQGKLGGGMLNVASFVSRYR